MKNFTTNDLIHFSPKYTSFVGIDSDGCVFDTMEAKQKDFFHPAIIKKWNLEAIEPQVRTVAEFVYLYSQNRGLNRFLGLCKTFELLSDWSGASNHAIIPNPTPLRSFCNSGLPLANETLRIEAERTQSTLLFEALEWSLQLNLEIDQHMPDPPPFPGAEKALKNIAAHSDAIVISQTQAVALLKDWYRDNLAQYVSVIAGSELGSKMDHFKMATTNRYPAHAILMIGDAPGDLAAANAIGCNFFPINPNHEIESWQHFLDEGHARFLSGGFSSDYQQQLNHDFNALLPENPPWK